MLNETIDLAQKKSAWRQLGKLGMGVKVSTGFKQGKCEHPQTEMCYYCSRPMDLDYFVLKEKNGTTHQKSERLHAILGAEPKTIPVVLMNPRLEDCFDTAATMYSFTGVACHTSDGVSARRYMKARDGEGNQKKTKDGKEDAYEWTEIPCPGMKCEFREAKKCAVREYLRVAIPTLGKDFPIGEFVLESGSKTSAAQIYQTLKKLEEYCINKGRQNGIMGIPLVLRREPRDFQIDAKGNGKRTKVTKSIAVIDVDWWALLREDQELLLPLLGVKRSLLVAPEAVMIESVVLSEEELGVESEVESGAGEVKNEST